MRKCAGMAEQHALQDFKVGALLGEGSYASVLYAVFRATGTEVALKVLDKRHIQRHNKQRYVFVERDVLSQVDHPNLMHLHSTFQDAASLYFVLDYCPAELLPLIQQHKGLSLFAAQFIMAELLLALEHLHNKKIIHRDLKPENILFSGQGHVVLTDFGTAKIVDEKHTETRRSSFVGTAEYVCPELLRNEPTGYEADFWSLGCVLFTMLTGHPPFHDASAYLTFQRVQAGVVDYPDTFPVVARELCAALLQLDPAKRPTAAVLHGHPFFVGIDWTSLATQPSPLLAEYGTYFSDELQTVRASVSE